MLVTQYIRQFQNLLVPNAASLQFGRQIGNAVAPPIQNESMAELHHALDQIRDREREYLYYRFGFDDEDVERSRKDTAEHFHITESSAKRTEKTALDNVWLELPWWFR